MTKTHYGPTRVEVARVAHRTGVVSDAIIGPVSVIDTIVPPPVNGFDFDEYVARARVATFRHYTRPTAKFAATLAASKDDDAARMLNAATARLVHADDALERGDLDDVHTQVDKAKKTMTRLAGHCQTRERELAPAHPAKVACAIAAAPRILQAAAQARQP